MELHPVDVVGVRVEMPSNQPIVLLKETSGDRYLPIWVGAAEATSIAFAQQGIKPPRPLTHDLIADLLDLLDAKIQAVHLTELRDGVFYAELLITGERTLSARPLATEELFNEAGIDIPDQAEDEVEKFREFLDQINPEDFLG